VLKPIVSLAAVGFVGVILYKLLWLALLPVFGFVFGIVAFVLKIALIAGLIWLGFFVFRKVTEKPSEA